MDDPAGSRLRDALLAYTTLALGELKAAGHRGDPQEPRGRGWQPRGEGHFSHVSAADVSRVAIHLELTKLHGTKEHQECVEALRSHPVIRDRLDTLVGTTFNSSRLDSKELPDRLVWSSLDQDPDSFDEARFDAAFAELYSWLIRDRERFVVIAPVVGLELEGGPIELEPDVELDAMSEDEVVAVLTGRLIQGFGSADLVMLRKSERAAVRIRAEFPIVVGGGGSGTADHVSASRAWGDIVEAVVQALRLFKPGTVSVPGLAHFQDVNGRATHTLPSRNPSHGVAGTYELATSEHSAFVDLWRRLASPEVASQTSLTTALRRFSFAGERIRPEDQIIDLMIAAEAVFLVGEQTESAHKLALRSAVYLADNTRPVDVVFRHMKRGYGARSTLAHGGALKQVRFADDTPATLEQYVELISDYMRVALQRLVRSAATGETLPTSRWDDYVLDALS